MAAQPPAFPPLMLRCLPYREAVTQMRVTGCAIRRHHWCSPVLRMEGGVILFDNEEQVEPWEPTTSDLKATDWEMTENPVAAQANLP